MIHLRYSTVYSQVPRLTPQFCPCPIINCNFVCILFWNLRNKRHKIILFFSEVATQGLSHRNLSFASYYGDHMVLQKAPKRANIWGYAPRVSEIVRISLDATPLGTARSRMGPSPGTNVWSFQLPETAPGGPHTLTAETSQEKITLSDVMFGDVWICSGQSNMQFTLNMVRWNLPMQVSNQLCVKPWTAHPGTFSNLCSMYLEDGLMYTIMGAE